MAIAEAIEELGVAGTARMQGMMQVRVEIHPEDIIILDSS